MKIFFWMTTSFKTTSKHMLISVLTRLCEEHHSVTVVQRVDAGEDFYIPDELKNLNIEYKFVKSRSLSKNSFLFRYFSEAIYFIKSQRFLTKDFDSVFIMSSNMGGIPVLLTKYKSLDIRVVYNVQDIFPENAAYIGIINSKKMVFKVLSKVQYWAYKKSDCILTISEDMKETLVLAGADADKIKVVFNWAYGDSFYSLNENDKTRISGIFSSEKFNVLYAGNIGFMQNVDVIIESAKLLKNQPDIMFYIIGDGALKKTLIEKSNSYGLTNISFLPMMSSNLACALYASADVNVIPLAPNIYKTALPSKTAICISCLKPLIFCLGKHSKFADFVKKQSSCINVESADAVSLSDAILSVKQHPEIQGYENLFSHFGLTENTQKYVDIITGKRCK